ncbi:MAG: Azurin/Glucose/arabinose dehydrogenase, beta-propeller fold [Verrucomicrobia bacterium]|nr:MAG: Azurin/Glucose/arabinose dehydrogenase, beta-propeller fold [Verrucomicrobiota bacterium]
MPSGFRFFLPAAFCLCVVQVLAQGTKPLGEVLTDAKSLKLNKPQPAADPELARYAMYQKDAPLPGRVEPVETSLPLSLRQGERIAFIGNTLFDRDLEFGYFESMLHQSSPDLQLVVRNLSWSADELTLQPRPENFAGTEQHLLHEKADVMVAAFGFNESFAGPEGLSDFRRALTGKVVEWKSSAFNGKSGPRIVLVSPVANENVTGVTAADRNNVNLRLYTEAMRDVAEENGVGFVDVFHGTEQGMRDGGTDLTINGCHLNGAGYQLFASLLFQGIFGTVPPGVDEEVRKLVVDKNRQFFRRFRPLNTFYYTGGRNTTYGYLDFLPAMRSFEVMTANRDAAIHALVRGGQPGLVNDANVPQMPPAQETIGANEWLRAEQELAAFRVDPRFEVSLFAGEEQFPDIANPIQIRWDGEGRLWVACSTTYPHLYPGQEPRDKLVILEDVDGDGKADRSSVWADDLHIPLSFEFGDGGVYVSEQPHLTFLKDTDGDGRADFRERLLTGFGTEDSHHSLHDIVWTPDGDLIFRESIFHHSQVETPYGPVRQQNSGWFRFEPRRHRLTSFGTYPSTNPWGVTFDDWGQHVASHPIYAAAFHALDPAYPEQHPAPTGLTAYSGTCGQEFIDFPNWPAEFRGNFVKLRYKPTNRVELLAWRQTEFGFDEEYLGDLLFSTNLSFIPVDLQFGPRGDLFLCDWYNPVKGHAQYSLRDPRRRRDSGRIWRLVPKGFKPQPAPVIAQAATTDLVGLLARPEYRCRYWAKRELRERAPAEVQAALQAWLQGVNPADPRYPHHQLEALWLLRGLDLPSGPLLTALLDCDQPLARAAATEQLRFAHGEVADPVAALRARANDPSPVVRMQAAIAASYIGTQAALEAALETLKHPHKGHLAYAIRCSLGSRTLKPHWQGNEAFQAAHPELAVFLKEFEAGQKPKAAKVAAGDAAFDQRKNLARVRIACVREQLRFDLTEFQVKPGQPVKLVFSNPDATPHNLVIAKPGHAEEIGVASNEMAKDPTAMQEGQFIPKDKISLMLHRTKMLAPGSEQILRFEAPREPGRYPYLCTFPGHWFVMKGEMVVNP